MRALIPLLLAISFVLFTPPAQARTVGSETGLPLPRYVTIRAAEAYLRTGPGIRYPIDWVLVRRDMPVEVIAEFENWRKVRDFEKTEGWVHQSMLSGKRTVRVISQIGTLRRDPEKAAPAVARMEAGVLGRLDECRPEWCQIEVSGLTGWVHRSQIWGVQLDEGLH